MDDLPTDASLLSRLFDIYRRGQPDHARASGLVNDTLVPIDAAAILVLAREVAIRMAPEALLDSKDVAAILKVSTRHFMDRIAKQPGFPDPILLFERGHPRWRRADVMVWIDWKANRPAAPLVRRPGRPRKTPS